MWWKKREREYNETAEKEVSEKSYKWSEEVGACIFPPKAPPPSTIKGKHHPVAVGGPGSPNNPTSRWSQNLVQQGLEATPASLGNTN